MDEQSLCLMTVHAHPDDESSKGAPTVAKYHAEGVRTVLVCCTGGEQGEILNPAMESDHVRDNLAAIRRDELATATKIIGYDHVEMLGYEDSGMAGSGANENPKCFARADANEAVGRLVAHIRTHKPQVIVTYGDEQEFYPHPDHLRVHDVSIAAFAAAGDSAAYPEFGPAWQPLKLYYSIWSIAKLRLIHETLLRAGVDSPFPETLAEFADSDKRITTRLDVGDWISVRAEALRAHATQIDPNSPMWFGMSDDVLRKTSGEDDYILAQSEVAASLPETDLFAGIR